MTEHGSPNAGESTEYSEIHNGRRCRVVEQVWERHTPNLIGKTWAPHDHMFKVYEYAPEPAEEPAAAGRAGSGETTGFGSAESDVDLLPEWMRESLAGHDHVGDVNEMVPEVEESTTPRADKFAYHKALRGRFGKGRELTETEYIVLSVLWDYADADLSNARPGNTRLAQDLGYSGPHAARTAGAHVKSLERKRFAVCTRRSGGRGSAATYRLTLPEWEVPRPQ